MLDRPWGSGNRSGNLSLNKPQDTYKICRTKGLLFGEQMSTLAGKVCLSEDMLDVCDHRSWMVEVSCSQQFSTFATLVCGHAQSTYSLNM